MAAQPQDFVPRSNTLAVASRNPKHRLHIALFGLIACAVLASGQSQAGQYYKWVDDKGVTHFSEKPVPGADAKKMTNTAKNSQVSEEPEPAAQSDAAAPLSDPAATKTDAAAATQAQPELEKNCKIAQDRLKALQSGQRIRLSGPNGSFTYLDENQIKEETLKTQDVLNAQCKK
jgi:hypothetical protein